MSPRLAARIDENHREIVAALRKVGCSVLSLASLGKGVPDLLVARPDGVMYLMEVKQPKGTLTDDQSRWIAAWHGDVRVVRSVAHALAVVGIHTVED